VIVISFWVAGNFQIVFKRRPVVPFSGGSSSPFFAEVNPGKNRQEAPRKFYAGAQRSD
jgi:hypothetical protein